MRGGTVLVVNPKPSVTINQVPIVWDTETGDFTFFGLSAVSFWANPSLFRMLAPLVDEISEALFRLLVAHSSSFGTDEDYNAMVTTLGSTFEQGFLAWGRAVGAAGWGAFEILHFDRDAGTARVRVTNPWELRMQRAGGRFWGCPFMQGKVIGIFGHALGRSCWADEELDTASEVPAVVFSVYPSDRTLDEELRRLRAEQVRMAQAQLAEQVEEATAALLEKRREVEERDRVIRTLSTPILQVWDGVLVVPVVGELSATRAEMLNTQLLDRVVAGAAEQIVLDLTGLSNVDDAVVDRLGATIAASRLLGTQCAVVGLSPELAKAMVELGVSLGGVPVLRTLADALREVVGLSRRTRKKS